MNKWWNEETKKTTISLIIAGIALISFYLLVTKITLLQKFISSILTVLMPFIFGYAIAFLLTPVMFKIESLLNKTKLSKKTNRIIATTLSILFLLLILTVFFVVIIPQLANSFTRLSDSFESYYKQLELLANDFSRFFDVNLFETIATQLQTYIAEIGKYFSEVLPSIISTTISTSIQVIKVVVNLLMGIIIAVYILFDYEKFHHQARKLLYAIFPYKFAKEIHRVSAVSSKMFGGFVVGKALDSLIIGILCLIGCLIFNFPYPVLLAFIIGVTNMIPFFGPFIGAIPSIFLLLIINPIVALEFAIFILALQQLDGNVIGPKILGNSLGMPSIMIILSVIVGGSLFGIVGMFIGVPIIAIIYSLTRDYVNAVLKKKKLEDI